jgi:putative hemolysin
MGAELWVVLLGLVACMAAAIWFAVAEAALFALGKWQARQMAERSGFSGALLKGLLDQPSRLIATLALGSTAAHFGIIWFGFLPVLQGRWPWLATTLGMVALLLGLEAVAKIGAVRSAEKWSLRLALSVSLFHKAVCWISIPLQESVEWTIRRIVPKSIRPQAGLSDDEYKELLELAHDQGAIARSERDIILQIISLDRKTAGDVMRPRTQIAAVSDDASIEEMVAAARKHKHRRLPIYDETLDTIVGVLNTRRLLLNPEIDLSEAIEFPSNVPETMNLLQLLKSLQRQQRGMAIVLDEFGGTAGLVTTEDILEEVVGDIRDRFEPPEFIIEKLDTGGWKVSGATPIEKFRLECPDIGVVPDVETVGGLVVKLFEVVPVAGQSITWRNLRLTAQQADERRVREVLVEPLKKR